MKKTLSQIYYYFSLVLIVFLPFQSLLLSVFQDKLLLSPSVSFWLAHWYEPVILVIMLLTLINIVRGTAENSKTSHFVRRIAANWPALLLVLFGLFSAVFFSPALGRGMEGFRFDLLPVLIFLLIAFQNFSKEKAKILFKTYVVMAILVAVWAIAERFLPPNYWSNLGLTFHGYGYFGFGKFSFGVLNQSASFIGGPNQLGSYLLPAVFIVLNNLAMKQFSNEKYRLILTQYISLIILIIGVAFSFSRSAWVGGLVGLLAFLLFYMKNIKLKYSLLAVAVLLLIGLFVAYKNIPAVRDIMIHSSAADDGTSSQDSHDDALQQSLKELKNRSSKDFIFGSGIGTAGPAAIKYSDGIVSESWYIQLLLEIGLIGLVLWLAFIGTVLFKTYTSNPALFLSFLAISATSLFLHTWADNPAVAMTLFILAGVYWRNPDSKHLTN